MYIYVIIGSTKWGTQTVSAHSDLEVANQKAKEWLREALLDKGFSPEEIDEAFEKGEEFDLHDEFYFTVEATTLDA